jgi:hypothetical protein
VAPLIVFVLTVTLENEPVLMLGDVKCGEVKVGCQNVTAGATVAQIAITADGAIVALVRIRAGSIDIDVNVAGVGVVKIASNR